jgi:phage head maturation protease
MATVERPKVGEVEERQAPALEVDGKKIRGLIPYGIESRDMGGWVEVIEPTALRAARVDDLVATVDHVGVPIGRFPTTLEIEDRGDGLHWAVTPPESRSDVREAIERRDLKAGSWRMRVGRDEWRGNVRHVHEITDLIDVSVVSHPSYPSAGVELRSHNDNDATRDRKEKMDQQDQQEGGHAVSTPEQHDDESRAIPEGSLRVEERAEAPMLQSLADAFAQGGFFENRVAQIGWDEYRSFTWSAGTVLTDLNPVRREGIPLAYDSRWLYPVLPTTAVDDATTAVQYLRQSSRSLAGTAVIRPLTDTSTKPETSTTVEYQTLQLQQVATICKDIPRIHTMQPMFQSLVEQDLRLAIGDGLDEVARRGIAQAGTIVKGSDDILEVTRKAMTLVEADGYSPNVLAIDPAGAQALDLLRTPGTEKFYIWSPGSTAPGPFGLSIRVWKTAGTAVLDTNAYGRMYISPVELRAFEQDAGSTNRQTVRMETNAGYTVERIPAARRIT